MSFSDVEEDKLQEVSLEEKKPLIRSLSNSNTNYDNTAGSGASPLDGFFKRVESIQSEIAYFISLIEQVKSMRKNEIELGRLEQKSQLHVNNINEQMKAIKDHIRDLIQYCNTSSVEYGDHQIRKIQIDALKKRFIKAIEDQQKFEKQFHNELKERIVRQFKITNPDANPEEIELAISNNDTTFFSTAVLNSTRKDSGMNALEEVQQRHMDIRNIENSITELNEMYQSMSTMVELQDPLIDNIKQNVEESNQNLDQVNVELGVAKQHAKSARRKKFYFLFLGLAALLFLLAGLAVYIYFQTAKK